MAQQEVAERLQHDRARRIGADRLLLDVDPAGCRRSVSERTDRGRSWTYRSAKP
jgi:hypothetical protein